MATLEKIRSKSVILFIVIIVALLAFILGDLFRSGRMVSSSTTVYKVGSTKVDYFEYQKAVSDAVDQMNQSGQRQADHGELQQQVLQGLMLDKLVKEECDRLGITVSDEMLSAIMLQNPQTSYLYGILANPAQYTPDQINGIKAEIREQETEMEKNIRAYLYNRLLMGLFQPNKLDAQAVFDETYQGMDVQYVAVPVVPNDSIAPTQAELRAAWDGLKSGYYMQQPTAVIDYIVVNIAPSNEDRLAARQLMESVQQTLRTNNELEGLSEYKGIHVNRSSDFAEAMHRSFPEVTDSILNTPGSVVLLPATPKTIRVMKTLGVENKIDTVKISMLAFANKAEGDSLMNVIASGVKLDTIIAGNPNMGRSDLPIVLNGPNAMTDLPALIRDVVENAAIGEPSMLNDSTANVQCIIAVNSRNAAKPLYDYATIEYDLKPSYQTQEDLASALRNFVASNPTDELLVAAAADSGYFVQVAQVNPGTPNLTVPRTMNTIDKSRSMIKWIMDDAKPGQVSRVYRTNINGSADEVLYVVAVAEKHQPGYLPYTSKLVADQVEMYARRDHAANELLGQYQGKASDLNGYSKLMGAQVMTANNVRMSSPSVGSIPGRQPELRGRIAAAKPGELVGPFAAENSVVVFVANPAKASQHRDLDVAEDGRIFMSRYGFNGNTILPILTQGKKVVNRSLEFETSLDGDK